MSVPTQAGLPEEMVKWEFVAPAARRVGVPLVPPTIMSPTDDIGLVTYPGHPTVVAPPLESVQKITPVPETVPEVKRKVSAPCSEAAVSWPEPLEPTALAETGIDPPFTLTTVVAKVPEVVTSPLRFPLVIEVAPEKAERFPAAGVPVVVTVPAPALIVLHPNPVPVVQISALVAPEHEGSARPLGTVAVRAPSTWLAARTVKAE